MEHMGQQGEEGAVCFLHDASGHILGPLVVML